MINYLQSLGGSEVGLLTVACLIAVSTGFLLLIWPEKKKEITVPSSVFDKYVTTEPDVFENLPCIPPVPKEWKSPAKKVTTRIDTESLSRSIEHAKSAMQKSRGKVSAATEECVKDLDVPVAAAAVAPKEIATTPSETAKKKVTKKKTTKKKATKKKTTKKKATKKKSTKKKATKKKATTKKATKKKSTKKKVAKLASK